MKGGGEWGEARYRLMLLRGTRKTKEGVKIVDDRSERDVHGSPVVDGQCEDSEMIIV